MTLGPSVPAPAPPKGYRPRIPLQALLEAALAQAVCPDCGERIGSSKNAQRDHRPPLQMRVWDAEASDTVPAANDPAFIVWRHIECHAIRTSGRRTKARAEGDQTEIAKVKRLAAEQEAFRQRVLAKDVSDAPPERRSKWPKRPMRSGK